MLYMPSKDIIENESKARFCMATRVVTTAPLMVFLMLSIAFFANRPLFQMNGDAAFPAYAFMVAFLTVLPLLAYPLQQIVPALRKKGRDGQRHLAMLAAVIGYIGAAICALVLPVSSGIKVISFSYLISGVLLLICSKCFKIKASGHACGVVGPMILLLLFCGWWGLMYLPLVALVVYSSLKIKRHTLSQLALGACIAMVSVLLTCPLLFL